MTFHLGKLSMQRSHLAKLCPFELYGYDALAEVSILHIGELTSTTHHAGRSLAAACCVMIWRATLMPCPHDTLRTNT